MSGEEHDQLQCWLGVKKEHEKGVEETYNLNYQPGSRCRNKICLRDPSFLPCFVMHSIMNFLCLLFPLSLVFYMTVGGGEFYKLDLRL